MTGTMTQRGACGGSPLSNAFVVALVATAVLLAGADAHRDQVLDVQDRVRGHAGFDQPAKEQVLIFAFGRLPLHAVDLALVGGLGGPEIVPRADPGQVGQLGDDAAIDEALEIHAALAHELLQADDVADAHHPQVLAPRQHRQGPFLEFRGHHHLGVAPGDLLGGGAIQRAVQRDAAAEGGHPVGEIGLYVGLDQAVGLGHPAGVVVLHHGGGGLFGEVAQDVEGVVGIGEVDLLFLSHLAC
mgnify:CR=1 FL=1